jgi:dolichol-phosphate mannosyltransferase
MTPVSTFPQAASERAIPHAPPRPLLTVVTPAFNEAANLPLLYERLCKVLDGLPIAWEWVVVDDHSADETFAVVAGLAREDARVQGLRLARNSGSHLAVTCGLLQASGDCAVIMAADLQDPPETLPDLLKRWREGAQVIWAVRERRDGESAGVLTFSRLYYFLMRRVAGLKQLPANGADFFLLDRAVLDALRSCTESNTSLFGLITWMGFRQKEVSYVKEARASGKSGWNLAKKIRLVVDSFTAFSYFPIRLMAALGATVAFIGFLYALVAVGNALFGAPVEGWTSLMVVVLVLGGLQLTMMGVLGEYVCRALDEARKRPRFLIEARTREKVPGALIAGISRDAGRQPVHD